MAITGGVATSILVAPVVAGLAVGLYFYIFFLMPYLSLMQIVWLIQDHQCFHLYYQIFAIELQMPMTT